jgi:hypothetical protein
MRSERQRWGSSKAILAAKECAQDDAGGDEGDGVVGVVQDVEAEWSVFESVMAGVEACIEQGDGESPERALAGVADAKDCEEDAEDGDMHEGAKGGEGHALAFALLGALFGWKGEAEEGLGEEERRVPQAAEEHVDQDAYEYGAQGEQPTPGRGDQGGTGDHVAHGKKTISSLGGQNRKRARVAW